MAVRYRPERKAPWQCYWNNPYTGKRESASFETQEEALKEDSLIKHRLRFDREFFRKEDAEGENNNAEITLEAAYLLYLKSKQFSKKSVAWQLDCMKLPLQQLGQMPVAEIERGHIQSIMDAMGKMPVKSATVRDRLSVFRTVLRWAAEQGLRGPVDFPKLPPAHYQKFMPPTSDELAAMLQVAPDHIQRVIIIGAYCGVRVGPSELFRLTWGDVDLTRRVLRVHGSRKNEAAPWREVPIRESLLSLFEQWQAADLTIGAQHLIHWKGKPVLKIKTSWKDTLNAAGITRRIRPYDLRHAFATEAIAAGADVGTVASIMGHSSPQMILTHYQYVLTAQKRAAVNALPDIPYVPACAQRHVPENEAHAELHARA